MRLRSEVAILQDEATVTVCDQSTGLKLVVSHALGEFLERLRDGSTPDNDNAHEPVLSVLSALGLLSDATPEQARGRQARYILTDAEESERARVEQTVERAYRQTALHREHLHAALHGGEPWQLSSLPILDKAQLRRHFPRGLTVDSLDLGAALRSGDLTMASTSGTTGERLQVYSDTRLPRLPANFARLWGLTRLPTDRPLRTAVLTSPGCSAGVCTRQIASMEERISFEHTLFLASVRDPFELSRAQIETIFDELTRFAPDLWVVHPIFLQLLTERAAHFGVALPALTVQAIVTTYQYCPESLRRRFVASYGLPVFQLYAATELGGSQVGVSCRYGTLHVRLDHVYLELLCGEQPVTPGELGNPVVTTHHPSMPLVRYRLSDLARFALEPCACEVGSAWPGMLIEGRERDAFVRPHGLVTTAMVDGALSDLPSALYQLSELRPGRFRLAVVGTPSHEARERLTTLLQTSELQVVSVTRLALEENGKFRYTVPHQEPRHA
jgi:phenylacetate-coenzyme A ligase PaaK-like adenylate-forming protein